MVKDEFGPFSLTMHKNMLEMDQRYKSKNKFYKCVISKHGSELFY